MPRNAAWLGIFFRFNMETKFRIQGQITVNCNATWKKNTFPLKSMLIGGISFIKYFGFGVNIVQFCAIKIRTCLRYENAIDKVFLLQA